MQSAQGNDAMATHANRIRNRLASFAKPPNVCLCLSAGIKRIRSRIILSFQRSARFAVFLYCTMLHDLAEKV